MARTSKTDTVEIAVANDPGATQTPIVQEMEDLCRLFTNSVAAQGAIIADQWSRIVELAAYAAEVSHEMILSTDISESDMEEAEALAKEMEGADPADLIAQLQAELQRIAGGAPNGGAESNGTTAAERSADADLPHADRNTPADALVALYHQTVHALGISFMNTVTAMQQLNITGQAMTTMAVTQIFSTIGVAAAAESVEG